MCVCVFVCVCVCDVRATLWTLEAADRGAPCEPCRVRAAVEGQSASCHSCAADAHGTARHVLTLLALAYTIAY